MHKSNNSRFYTEDELNRSGRQKLCFHKPGIPGSNARLISIFITYVQIMKPEPELNILIWIKNKHSVIYFVAIPGL